MLLVASTSLPVHTHTSRTSPASAVLRRDPQTCTHCWSFSQFIARRSVFASLSKVKIHPSQHIFSSSTDGLVAVHDMSGGVKDDDENFKAALNVDTSVEEMGLYGQASGVTLSLLCGFPLGGPCPCPFSWPAAQWVHHLTLGPDP